MTTDYSPEDIRRALWENQSAPNGPLRNARGEELVAAAESTGDRDLLRTALFGLIKAYEYSTERGKMLVPFARLLQEWDQDPSVFDGGDTHTFHWMFKWVSSGMLTLPEIPLATIERWLAEMERRYRTAGFTERAVRQAEFELAEVTGDTGRSERAFEAWTAAERDRMANCHACELNDQGTYWMDRGQDDKALAIWEPVLADRSQCAEEPHRVLALSLLPLVRTGRLEEARANHLRGYRMARGNESLLSSIGRHIEFCALTGNEGRGLELLAEHSPHLSSEGNAYSRLALFTGALTLLRRLLALGLDEQPAVPMAGQGRTVRELHDLLDAEAASIAARFDARNGSEVVSGRLRRRLECPPLVDRLPLGVRAASLSGASVPGASASAASLSAAAGAVARRAAEAGAGAGTGAAADAVRTVSELAAEARELRGQGHPGAPAAWDRIESRLARDGAEPDPLLAADLLERRAMRAVRGDGAGGAGGAGGTGGTGISAGAGEKAVRELFEEVVAAYRAVGEPSRAALNELRVAYAATQAGAPPEEIRALLATADASARGLAPTDPTRRRRIATVALSTVRLGPTLRHPHEGHEEHGENHDGSGGEEHADAHDFARVDAELAAFVEEFGAACADEAGGGPGGPESPTPEPGGPESPTPEPGGPGGPGDLADLGDLGDLVAEAEVLRADCAWQRGDADQADAMFVSAVRHSVGAGRPWDAAEPLARRARLLLALGRPQEAEAAAREALEHGAELVAADELGRLRLTLADVLYGRHGKEAEAAEYALEAAHWFDAAGESAGAGAYARLLLAQAYGESGRHAEAAEVLESALPDLLEHGEEQAARAREVLGRNLRALGDRRAAAEQYLLAAEVARGWDDIHPQAHLATLAAECLSEAGLGDEAAAAYQRAIELWRNLGAPGATARAVRSLAWLKEDAGDHDTAKELMAEALAAVEGEGDELLLERARTWSQTGELLLNGLYDNDYGNEAEDEEADEPSEADAVRVREEALRLLEQAGSAFAALGTAVLDERVRCTVRMAWTEQEMDRNPSATARVRALIDELSVLDTDEARTLVPRLEQTLKQLTA
ncbi:tetratricopeptide repeat protein [Streptomyces sp. GMY02]|uniref:tetratricopeptide repeat protein n=1 Tax=Streptomyces sp. GMY02 TaxID=1333528 RepID=UPI001C2BDD3C|nr:tetratricopeptide repeat protein [Streptomyces sp. GMY02]QXE35083.1 tetratricopeptide repeat protein [Streptomyces sp. GMY02]